MNTNLLGGVRFRQTHNALVTETQTRDKKKKFVGAGVGPGQTDFPWGRKTKSGHLDTADDGERTKDGGRGGAPGGSDVSRSYL